MKKMKSVFSAMVLVAGVGFAVFGLTSAAAPLPGINGPDAFAQGCVDCHKMEGTKDMRINTGLLALKGVKHPDISKMVKLVPDDCFKCHKPGTKMALNTVLHREHYNDPAKNYFVLGFQGQCLNCHKLDPQTGVMSNKSGPANW